ncbi:MAG: HEPN domain-containing protein [Halobacteriota archaeon]
MNFAETLFAIARKDLEAAKCLFESELYPQAVFYLQQSVEKANKSFAILNNIIKEDEKDLKDVGHDSMEVYKRSFKEQKEKLEKLNEAFKKIPKLKEIKFMKNFDVEKYYKGAVYSLVTIKSLGKERERILFIPKSNIMSVIKELDKLELQELDLKHMEFSKKDLNEAKESYIELLDVFYNFNPQKIEKEKEEFEKIFTLNLMEELIEVIQSMPIKDAIYVSYSLFYLSLIMLPHAIVARYPDDNCDPLKLYNQNLPLIQLFDDLVEIMEKTLSKLGNLLSEY